MPKLPFMRFYPGDYLLATRILTDTEKAIWMDLLCFMWLQENDKGNLEMDIEDLARMLGRDRLTVRLTLDTLKSKAVCDLFYVQNGASQLVKIGSRRMQRDAKSLILTNKRVKTFNASINARLTHTLTPKKSEVRSHIKDPPTPQGGDGGGDDFEDFWEAYPKKEARVAALKEWVELSPELELMAKMGKALKVQKKTLKWTKEDGRFVPSPATWLKERRWEDEIGGSNAKPIDKLDRIMARENAETTGRTGLDSLPDL